MFGFQPLIFSSVLYAPGWCSCTCCTCWTCWTSLPALLRKWTVEPFASTTSKSTGLLRYTKTKTWGHEAGEFEDETNTQILEVPLSRHTYCWKDWHQNSELKVWSLEGPVWLRIELSPTIVILGILYASQSSSWISGRMVKSTRRWFLLWAINLFECKAKWSQNVHMTLQVLSAMHLPTRNSRQNIGKWTWTSTFHTDWNIGQVCLFVVWT